MRRPTQEKQDAERDSWTSPAAVTVFTLTIINALLNVVLIIMENI